RGYSTNFEVDRDGKIYEYADPAMWEAQATGGGANSHTIGIDVTHYGNQEFTQPQMDSLRKLVHALADRFKFPVVVAPDNDRREWKNWKGSGFTVFRHRNFLNTECPSTLPMEKLA
ncbi:MAG: N-acetylmuramoyl-L-alanine amidase, partial [Actinobacteria bacterium]|nr:N-acetylmuramoyl-L-alanine amidase [Actinomycetota bacterium]